MLLILWIQGQAQNLTGAQWHVGSGSALAQSSAVAVATSRRYHPVAQYEMMVDNKYAEYVHEDQKGT